MRYIHSVIFLLCLLPGMGYCRVLIFEPEFVSPQANIQQHPHIKIKGQITKGDLDALKTAIPRLLNIPDPDTSGTPLVLLDSLGGDVLAAMQVGSFLREIRAWVVVDQGAKCYSACILVLAGGIKRWPLKGADLAIHRPYFESSYFANLDSHAAVRRYDQMAESVRAYLRRMGIEDRLFSDMLRIPSNELRPIDYAYAEAVNLAGTDPAFAEWERARFSRDYGPEAQELYDKHLACLNQGIEERVCIERFPLPQLRKNAH